MTDEELFRAFLEQTGLRGDEPPRRGPGATIEISENADVTRYEGHGDEAFFVTFDEAGKLVKFGLSF